MERGREKISSGARLGVFLLLLLVTRTVVQATALRDDTADEILPEVPESKESIPVHLEKTNQNGIKDTEKLGNNGLLLSHNESSIASKPRSKTTIEPESITTEVPTISTIATIDLEKRITETEIPFDFPTASPQPDDPDSTTSFSEFEITEEHSSGALEESANSDLEEVTTPGSIKSETDRAHPRDDVRKHVEAIDISNTEFALDLPTTDVVISLENDTNVNFNRDGTPKDVRGTKNDEFVTNDPLDGNAASEYGPNDEVEVFKEATHPSTQRLVETVSIDEEPTTIITTVRSEDPKPKPRTISFLNEKNLPTDSPKTEILDHGSAPIDESRVSSSSDTSLVTPYPYAVGIRKTESTTEASYAYENTIGRQKSKNKLIVTESSALYENTIHQFKPINQKRSGNSSRIHPTFDASSTTAASVTTTPKNIRSTDHGEGTYTGEKVSQDNDIPRESKKIPETTETMDLGLSDVSKSNVEMTDRNANESSITAFPDTYTTPIASTDSEIGGEPISTDSNHTDRTTSNPSSAPKSFATSQSTSSDGIIPMLTTEAEHTTASSASSATTTPEVVNRTQIELANSTQGEEISTRTEIPSTSMRSTNQLTILVAGESSNPEVTTSTSNEDSTSTVQYEFVGLTESQSSSSEEYSSTSEKPTQSKTSILDAPTMRIHDPSFTTQEVQTGERAEQNETMIVVEAETNRPDEVTESIGSTRSFQSTSGYDRSDDPVSRSNFTEVTDTYEATVPPTTTEANGARNIDVIATDRGSDVTEDSTINAPTTTIDDFDEKTTGFVQPETIATVHRGIVSVSESTTQSTSMTTDLPEFPVSSEDITLFVKVIFEGTWTEVCPSLSSLRQTAASLLSQETGKTVLERNVVPYQTQCPAIEGTSTSPTAVLLYVVDDEGKYDASSTEILSSLLTTMINFSPTILHVEKVSMEPASSNNAIAVVAVSSVAFICLVLLAGLLFIMRKRQTRFNYGERCRPVSLDAYSLDSVSAYNSVRRKGVLRVSKRSYGNPAFEDSSVTPSHPLNFTGISTFCNDSVAIAEEFSGIPQVNARIDELPAGAEVKNRYANVVPLPETRVPLQKINNEPLTEYINASYVRGPKNATKYYIACQAPIESTVSDFWRMIWEQQSKVIIMLTDIVENGVEKCVEYIPPSEVTDCHRLYGDYQVTLKKREAKEKYAISTLHLKNLETNTYREVSHIWYLWPTKGVPSDGSGLIAILLEARALQRGGPGPIVIHCSPGTGRTGTLIALDLGIRQYEITRTIDVPRVVYTIRRDRAGAVQTKEQYAFIYKALNLYATKLAGGALESM